MNSVVVSIAIPEITGVQVTDDTLVVDLEDGRTIAVPLSWYPRLVYATTKERANYRIVGAGYGIHWPDLDEDIGVEGLLTGRRSMESTASLQRWLAARGNQTDAGEAERA
ncbi:MAG: DUF2442 domain-containing protein [Anaerolineales bacterium]